MEKQLLCFFVFDLHLRECNNVALWYLCPTHQLDINLTLFGESVNASNVFNFHLSRNLGLSRLKKIAFQLLPQFCNQTQVSKSGLITQITPVSATSAVAAIVSSESL